jgi:hypothetical protein
VGNVSGRLTGFRRRLENVEKALAETAEQEELAGCICKVRDVSPPTMAFSNRPDEFEAEMNQTCPVHGFRCLGYVMAIRFVASGRKHERGRLDDLLDEYYARQAEYERAKVEHDNQEV